MASFGLPAFSYHSLLVTIYHAEDLRYSAGGILHLPLPPPSHLPLQTSLPFNNSCWKACSVMPIRGYIRGKKGDGAKGAATVSRSQRTEFVSSLLYRDGEFHIHPGLLSATKEERILPFYIFETISNFMDFCHAVHSPNCPFY